MFPRRRGLSAVRVLALKNLDYGRSKSLYREQYEALGKRNLPAIERIVNAKYQRDPAFNRQHPFVDHHGQSQTPRCERLCDTRARALRGVDNEDLGP